MTFQVYREVSEIKIVAEVEGLTTYRLTSFVFDALRCEGGDEAGHDRDQKRHPQIMPLVKKYHVLNEFGRGRDTCMPEVDVRVLAESLGWGIEELLNRAAEHWKKHDAELRAATAARRSTP